MIALDTLRGRNPSIGLVDLLNRTLLEPTSLGQVVIVHGVRSDQAAQTSRPNWTSDELFLIARTNVQGDSIVALIDVLPTERWLDYIMYVEAITRDSIVIVGHGEMYGDAAIRKVYTWNEPSFEKWLGVADLRPGLPARFSDTREAAFYTMPDGALVVPDLGPNGLADYEMTVLSLQHDWVHVELESPTALACEEAQKPSRKDTVWVRLFAPDGRLLLKQSYGAIC